MKEKTSGVTVYSVLAPIGLIILPVSQRERPGEGPGACCQALSSLPKCSSPLAAPSCCSLHCDNHCFKAVVGFVLGDF